MTNRTAHMDKDTNIYAIQKTRIKIDDTRNNSHCDKWPIDLSNGMGHYAVHSVIHELDDRDLNAAFCGYIQHLSSSADIMD